MAEEALHDARAQAQQAEAALDDARARAQQAEAAFDAASDRCAEAESALDVARAERARSREKRYRARRACERTGPSRRYAGAGGMTTTMVRRTGSVPSLA